MALEKATERSRKNYFHSSSLCLFFYHSEMLVAKVFSLLSLFNPEWPIHDAEVLRDALVIITISIIFIAKVMKMSLGHPGYDAATMATTSTRPFLFANTFWCPFCCCYWSKQQQRGWMMRWYCNKFPLWGLLNYFCFSLCHFYYFIVAAKENEENGRHLTATQKKK